MQPLRNRIQSRPVFCACSKDSSQLISIGDWLATSRKPFRNLCKPSAISVFFFVFVQFNVPFKIISLISRRANQKVGRKREYPGKNHLTHPQVGLDLSHLWPVWGLEPTTVTAVRDFCFILVANQSRTGCRVGVSTPLMCRWVVSKSVGELSQKPCRWVVLSVSCLDSDKMALKRSHAYRKVP